MRLLLVSLAAAFAWSFPATARADTPAAFQQVDWANRNYGRRMRLHGGRYLMRRYPRRGTPIAKRCRHTSVSTRLQKVHYTDLTGNGSPEAVVELTHYRDFCIGRPVSERVLIAFAKTPKDVTELARIALTGVFRVEVHGRDIVVHRRDGRSGKWLRCVDVWRLRHTKIERMSSQCTPEP